LGRARSNFCYGNAKGRARGRKGGKRSLLTSDVGQGGEEKGPLQTRAGRRGEVGNHKGPTPTNSRSFNSQKNGRQERGQTGSGHKFGYRTSIKVRVETEEKEGRTAQGKDQVCAGDSNPMNEKGTGGEKLGLS